MKEYAPELFHRLIIKVSGEFLAGKAGFGFDRQILNQLTDDIIEVSNLGYEIGIILGGGNFYRGKELPEICQIAADNVGMLATLQNAIMVSECLKQKNREIEIFSAIPMPKFARYYTYQEAITSMQEGKICFFTGGTGNPCFTTDTAAILRAIELKSDLVLKGTKVDGIYTADPKTNHDATFIKEISYTDALAKRLQIMDMTAFSLARDHKIPIKVFNITEKGKFKNAVLSADVGTYVCE